MRIPTAPPPVYCTSCAHDQLIFALACIESLFEQGGAAWTLWVVHEDPRVGQALRAMRRPQVKPLHVAELGTTWRHPAVALAAVAGKRPSLDRLTWIAPEVFWFDSPETSVPHTSHGAVWRSPPSESGAIRFLDLALNPPVRERLRQPFPHQQAWTQWLTSCRLTPLSTGFVRPSEAPLLHVEATTSGGLASEQGPVSALDVQDVVLIEPSCYIAHALSKTPLSAPVLRHGLLPAVAQLHRSWLWLLSAWPTYQLDQEAAPFKRRQTWFTVNEAAHRIAAQAPERASVPIGPTWHIFPGPHTQHIGHLQSEATASLRQWSCPAPTHGDTSASSVRVTAIVSTYNAERFIEGCLADLVQQSLFAAGELEIVVVDSGSEQNERAIVLDYLKRYPHIRYLRTHEREGLYMAWNRAIGIAQGAYLTNANTDDRHHPLAFEVMATALDRSPEVGLVYANCLVTHKENAHFSDPSAHGIFNPPDAGHADVLMNNMVGPQPMWRKALHTRVGYFDSRYTVAADYEMWLRFAEVSQLAKVDQTLGLYLDRADSVEHDNTDLAVHETRAIRWGFIGRWGEKARAGAHSSRQTR